MRHRDSARRWASALLAALLLLNIFATTALTQQRATYANPVIVGDYPDPSIIREGRNNFWATATSAEWSPFFPLFHSRDLVNWRQVTAAFRTPPKWSVNSYWAPEISEDRGRYYIYYTARKKNGPLCVAVATASRPSGPYTDYGPLVCQEVGSIDPVTARDEKNLNYLIWKEDGNSRNLPTPLWAQQLSDDGKRLLGEKTELIRNDADWEGHVVEAPYILRRNGWFYLFYSGNACCGRGCNYALGVARARHLLGPWEKNPANPIMAANALWKCPGHGSVVTDVQGHTYLLYHAYSSRDSIFVGRQVLLDEIKWDASGWPAINGGKGPSGTALAPLQIPERPNQREFFDSFTAPQLKQGWLWPQANRPGIRLERRDGGWLTLTPGANAATESFTGGVLARLSTDINYVATTVVKVSEMKGSARAGLSAYGDGEHALGISVGDGKIIVWTRAREGQRVAAEKLLPKSRLLYLRMNASGEQIRFAFSHNGRDWEDAGGGKHDWDSNVNVALTVGGDLSSSVQFGWLRIKPLAHGPGRER
jgi:xylan 1,4-beta-xylosidase